jgi:hypothetical protein
MTSEDFPASPALSKRAVRRLIQRAFVLVGRHRHVRQHLREASLVTFWVIQDWNFAWTVEFDRGKMHFERRPAKHPDLTLTWRTAELFFRQIEIGVAPAEGFVIEGSLDVQRLIQPALRAFTNLLQGVMLNPFDDEGNRLA